MANVLYTFHYKKKLLDSKGWNSLLIPNINSWQKKIYFDQGSATKLYKRIPENIRKDIEIVKYVPLTDGE